MAYHIRDVTNMIGQDVSDIKEQMNTEKLGSVFNSIEVSPGGHMIRRISALWCNFMGHVFGPALESDLSIFSLEAIHIKDTTSNRDIPGFTRSRQCSRCGTIDMAIVLVLVPKANLPEEEAKQKYQN